MRRIADWLLLSWYETAFAAMAMMHGAKVPLETEPKGGMLDGRATDCKSAGFAQAGSIPAPPTITVEFGR